MIQIRAFLRRAAERLDLPQDIAAGLPRIEFDGFSLCRLDRHRGILAYDRERIVIALVGGTVTLEGAELEVQRMHREALTVTGTIRQVSFDGGAS